MALLHATSITECPNHLMWRLNMSKSYSHRSITLAPHPLYKVTHLSNQPLPRASPTLPLPPKASSFHKKEFDLNHTPLICCHMFSIIIPNPVDFVGKFFKTAVFTLGMEFLTMTMVKQLYSRMKSGLQSKTDFVYYGLPDWNGYDRPR